MSEIEPLPSPVDGDAALLPKGGAYVRADAVGLASSGLVLSAEAYRLHLYSLMDSVVAGHEGFLESSEINASQEAAVRELCAIGLWEVAEGGYRLLDEEGLSDVLTTYSDAGRVASVCVDGLGHVADTADPGVCARCHGPFVALPSG
jgi:hypothetical protein